MCHTSCCFSFCMPWSTWASHCEAVKFEQMHSNSGVLVNIACGPAAATEALGLWPMFAQLLLSLVACTCLLQLADCSRYGSPKSRGCAAVIHGFEQSGRRHTLATPTPPAPKHASQSPSPSSQAPSQSNQHLAHMLLRCPLTTKGCAANTWQDTNITPALPHMRSKDMGAPAARHHCRRTWQSGW
jgi:hypothetical protein